MDDVGSIEEELDDLSTSVASTLVSVNRFEFRCYVRSQALQFYVQGLNLSEFLAKKKVL